MKHKLRFLHLQLDLKGQGFWSRVAMVLRGRIHVLLHRDGHGEYRVYSVTATDPTKERAA